MFDQLTASELTALRQAMASGVDKACRLAKFAARSYELWAEASNVAQDCGNVHAELCRL